MSFHPVLSTHQTPAALSTSADDRVLLRATERFLAAARAMKDDGFFWSNRSLSPTSIRLRMLSGMVRTTMAQAWRRGPAGSYISPRSA